MENIILEKYNLSKNNVDILKDIDFSFDQNISLIGTASSGKTSLLRVLEQQYKVPRVYKNDMFFNSSVEDELKYLILNTNQKKLVQDLLLNVNLKIRPLDLSNKQKIKLSVLKALLHNKYISFDNILVYLDKRDRDLIMKYMKQEKIKYIIVSNDLNDLFDTEKTYIMNDGKIIAYGDSDKILLEEKLLKRLGFKLPFMIDLSLQLRDYRLINSIYLDKQKLIDKLWK